MAASVGATVASQVLGRTEAEKAFRPWWDKFEDQLIYGLITLGKKIHFYVVCHHIFPYYASGSSHSISVFQSAHLESS